jgi:ribose-phosphate pyrophosphokinase
MPIIFSFTNDNFIANKIAFSLNLKRGNTTIRHFPDSESYVKLNSNVKDQDIILVNSLDHPDRKAMPLLFFTSVAKEYGAKSIGLISPYLGYMRQDSRFHDGEAISSNIFAKFLSQHLNWLITVDPHLHRHKSLNEIYSIPTKVVHATLPIANWITNNVPNPCLIGPDEESSQWVSEVAQLTNAPFIILEKVRRGDRDVTVSVHDMEKYTNHTPIILDDIISTAQTMIETAHHLNAIGLKLPICIGIHPIFAANSYQTLMNAPISKVISCNTIPHPSNAIDISPLISEALKTYLTHL